MCLSVGVCEGGGVRTPPRERVSRAVAEGRRAECVCEAESELESVKLNDITIHTYYHGSTRLPTPTRVSGLKVLCVLK